MPTTKERPMAEIRPQVARRGQRFYDEPIITTVSNPAPCASAVAAIFGHQTPGQIRALSHFERTPLRWRKPGDGK